MDSGVVSVFEIGLDSGGVSGFRDLSSLVLQTTALIVRTIALIARTIAIILHNYGDHFAL